jgi:hypothetical protein
MNVKFTEDINTVGWPPARMQNHVFECHEEIRTMRARIAELKRDRERLDWLEANPDRKASSSFGRKIWWISSSGHYDTVRKTIDAAMEDKP